VKKERVSAIASASRLIFIKPDKGREKPGIERGLLIIYLFSEFNEMKKFTRGISAAKEGVEYRRAYPDGVSAA
jgi:hypothetical protein